MKDLRFVLVNTTHPGNVGATARAMKTMALSELRLVSPKRYPSVEATAMASGADDLLAAAPVCAGLDEALEGCRLVLGTSARPRGISVPEIRPDEAAKLLVEESQKWPVALMFGREAHGLTNEEMLRCQYLVNIPANPDFSSLNLAAAVQVLAYEVRKAALDETWNNVSTAEHEPADDKVMESFFGHLRQTMEEIGFLDSRQPTKIMARLRRLYGRARPDEREINILRGIFSASQRRHNHSSKST